MFCVLYEIFIPLALHTIRAILGKDKGREDGSDSLNGSG